MYDLVRRLNKYVDDEKLEAAGGKKTKQLDALRQGTRTFRELAATLGLFRKPPQETGGAGDELVGQLMDLLIEMRADARKGKDFATADRIRDSLAEIGVALEDHPGGTEWSVQ